MIQNPTDRVDNAWTAYLSIAYTPKIIDLSEAGTHPFHGCNRGSNPRGDAKFPTAYASNGFRELSGFTGAFSSHCSLSVNLPRQDVARRGYPNIPGHCVDFAWTLGGSAGAS